MKAIIYVLLICISCNPKDSETGHVETRELSQEREESKLQAILDSAKLNGAILIYDENKGLFYSNDFNWSKTGQLPASTFKITNSIIGLETGAVGSDSSVFVWDGEDRMMASWEEDLTLRQAFLRSCVPCYQELARNVGLDRMQSLIQKLDYGNIKVDSASLDMFWLEGNSRITPMEQIDFLRRLANSELAISARTEEMIKRIMILDQNKVYTLRGKTGWSIVDDHHNGWFVGYLTSENAKYFFATNVEPKGSFDMEGFGRIRHQVTLAALESLGILINPT